MGGKPDVEEFEASPPPCNVDVDAGVVASGKLLEPIRPCVSTVPVVSGVVAPSA
jgi:hypothetical protein